MKQREKKNAYFVIHSTPKAREAWIQRSGWQEWAHEACSKAEEGNDIFLCDFCFATGLNKMSPLNFINKKLNYPYFKSLTIENIVLLRKILL